MYKVIKTFTDLQDNHYKYNVGDVFPRIGLVVSSKRISQLASKSNLQGVPLIESIAEPEKTKRKSAKKE